MDAAQLNLGFTKVVSLIDGIAGIAQAQIGDLVGPTGLLTTVSTVDPIKVYFPVSEQEYLNYIKENPDAAKRAAQERQLGLQLILADGSLYPTKVIFGGPQVDVKDRHTTAGGTVPESGKYLRPGQFARVRAITNEGGACSFPSARSQSCKVVTRAVVGNDNKVSIRPVKVGERVGTEWIIEEGLEAG